MSTYATILHNMNHMLTYQTLLCIINGCREKCGKNAEENDGQKDTQTILTDNNKHNILFMSVYSRMLILRSSFQLFS